MFIFNSIIMINTNTKIDQLNLRVDNIDKQLSNLKVKYLL